MRTRMSGRVAGESGRPLPLCRFICMPLYREEERMKLMMDEASGRPPDSFETRF